MADGKHQTFSRAQALKKKLGVRALKLLPFTPPIDHSPFLEIPVELRMEVFTYVLIQDKPLLIGYNTEDMPRRRRRKGQARVHATTHCPQQPAERIDLRLALLNKQISQEVGTLAYGGNPFDFVRPSNLTDFKLQISSWLPFLKHVKLSEKFLLDCHPRTHWLKYLLDLKDCINLRSLTLPHLQTCLQLRKGISQFAFTREDALVLGQNIREQLARLRKHRETLDGGKEPLQIIKIARDIACEHASGPSDHCSELAAQINALLTKYFESGDEGFMKFQEQIQLLQSQKALHNALSRSATTRHEPSR